MPKIERKGEVLQVVAAPMEEVEKNLMATGLLYLLNSLVLHPAGYALALVYEGSAVPCRAEVVKIEGQSSIVFDEQTRAHGLAKLQAYLADEATPPETKRALEGLAVLVGKES